MPAETPTNWVFRNATLIDGGGTEARTNTTVIVENGEIREVSGAGASFGAAEVIDVKGAVLMPGLIDCHVHVAAVEASVVQNALLPSSYIAFGAARIMRAMLNRGFTTVRDAGGADYGLVRGIEDGLIDGPRLVISGKALSQTCGHGDLRGVYDERDAGYFTRRLGSIARICDGVPEVRKACREEIKAGAKFIKIMANGGVASPSDPIDFLQFSDEEILAIVDEAKHAKTYVAAHLYTDEAIRRAVELGVRSIEHCNRVTPETAQIMADVGAIACPTLITHQAMADEALGFGLGPDVVAKTEQIREAGLRALGVLKEAGVPMAYGSDLLGPMHRRQSEEFRIRGEVLSAADVIASATSTAATLINMEGRVGCIAPGAFADLIVVRGNPLEDVSLLADPEKNIAFVMKAGRVVRNELMH